MSVQTSLSNQKQREDLIDWEIAAQNEKQTSWKQKVDVWFDPDELNVEKYFQNLKQIDSKLKNWANTSH